MGITSLSYIAFAVAIVILYYCAPTRVRWVLLLFGSITYMVVSGSPILLIYPVVSVIVAWICTNRMESLRTAPGAAMESKCKLLLWIGVLANLGVLIILKYLNLGVFTYNAFAMRISSDARLLGVLHFAVPIGVSFYTMSVLGYIFDVYYGISKPEKNIAKLFLFETYFPLLVSGPIVRYKDVKDRLFEGQKLSYRNITFGAQRILWGFFKVLVISQRLEIAVKEIFGAFEHYYGIYIWVGMWLFAFQLYANFSGSMDIIIGISEMLGISLPENFRQPFFAETIQEFWQRWHITLGAWLKDYVLYPLLRTKLFMSLPGKWKDKLGKKRAKQYTTFIALVILWSAVGLWHGGAWKYIWGTGLLQCIYIIVSELLTPGFKKIKEKLKIEDKTKWFRVFRKLRTFVLISVGLMFFNANSLTDGFRMLGHAFCTVKSGAVSGLGLEPIDWVILAFSMVIWCVASVINEMVYISGRKDSESEKTDVRDILAKRNIIIRWAVLLVLISMVVILGEYGPGCDAAEFIYQGF